MIILGIDPGLNCLGFCFLKKKDDSFFILKSGVLVLDKKKKETDRLYFIFSFFKETIKESFSSEEIFIFIESQFVKKSVSSAFSLVSCVSVFSLLAGKFNFSLEKVAPSSWRKNIGLKSKASKEEVFMFISDKFSKNLIKYQDEADAIAIALSGAMFKE